MIEISRDKASGIARVRGETLVDLYRGLGTCHARDRGMQMLLMRILGQGRLAEFLDPSDRGVEIDRFFRKMGWMRVSAEAEAELEPEARSLCLAYVEGVNGEFARRVPWELKVAGYRHEPWSLADSVILSRMMGYLTLAESQGMMERLIVEMIQAGVDAGRLEELFPGKLGGLDVELVRKVTLGERVVPEEVRWAGLGLPRAMASNNWVVHGSRTASGKPLLANDPHLEVNRLPNVWYEVALETPSRWFVGATLPGMPGLVVGRTPDIAWGATYSFMDAIDSWVEHCRDGNYRRVDGGGESWEPFRVRREQILRKGKATVEATFYENDHGVLDGSPDGEAFRLATKWSGAAGGPATLNAVSHLFNARTVDEGRALLGRVETAWNWVLVDQSGSVGYQMSGLCPLRREGWSGLVPVAGWDSANDWRGYAAPEDLPRVLNPKDGFFATANQDLNAHGRVKPITLPMGAYRAERIAEVLTTQPAVTVESTERLHRDVYSLQAESFMAILRPLLPDSERGRALSTWDCEYDLESLGAPIFEDVYRDLLIEVFGRGKAGIGESVVRKLLDETGVFADFYDCFDRILLAKESVWFGGESRGAIVSRVLERVLSAPGPLVPWRERQTVALSHIVFAGKLPRWTGFDRGPVALAGGRATVQQGQVYRSAGRVTTFAPSFRWVTDMAEPAVHSQMAGGPSDRRFSRRYASGLRGWIQGRSAVTLGQL